jgi:hypothetical protein
MEKKPQATSWFTHILHSLFLLLFLLSIIIVLGLRCDSCKSSYNIS